MPELPEVETFTRALRQGTSDAPSIIGLIVSHAEVLWPGTIETPSPRIFKQRIKGQQVVDVGRRGKYIVIALERDTLLMHLRMSGDLLIGQGATPLGTHPRLVLYFQGGWQLAFNNPRKFGRVWLLADPEQELGKLGPEPLDETLDTDDFHRRLSSRKRAIKPLLLDQSFIAGIGNIYADEALHLAHIHPCTPANSLQISQAGRLLEAIRTVLQNGIDNNGASIDWVYRGGNFQNQFRVYAREGEPCLECGTAVEKTVIGQRGTHFCPICQPAP